MAVSKRTGHIGVCVDQYMLVWGGYQESEGYPVLDHYLPPGDLWVYRTETKAWQSVALSGTLLTHHQEKLPLGTSGATANFLNGYWYVFGGHNTYGNSNYLLRLDLRACQWEVVVWDVDAPHPSPRDKLVSWAFRDKLYYFGGYGPSLLGFMRENGEFVEDETSYSGLPRGWNNQLLIFDTLTNEWSNPKCKGVVPVARAAHAAARIDNQVFVFGGRHRARRLGDLYMLNLDTLTWSKELQPVGDRPCGRSWHTLTKISDRRLFLYGGYSQDNKPLGDAWVLDVHLLQWSQLRLPADRPRLWHTCCVTRDEDILVFGGCSNDILSQTVPTVHCNDILEFRLSPKTLLRLCMDAAFCHRSVCQENWESLPQHLQVILRSRLDAWGQQRQPTSHQSSVSGDSSNRGQTCVIS